MKRTDIKWEELFFYDESSPTCLRWITTHRKGRGGHPVKRVNNGVAGNLKRDNSVVVTYDKWPYPVKNIVWELHNGPVPDGKELMYVDGDISNVKIENLYLPETVEKNHRYDKFLGNYFAYDESSPSCLRWIKKSHISSNMKVGDVAGSFDELDGYWKLHALSDHMKVHKVVWALHNDFVDQTGLQIDHIDGVRSNNRIENLRLVQPSLNARNQGLQKNSKTGVNGVVLGLVKTKIGNYTERYTATVYIDGKKQTKSFSPFVHGREKAFEMACEWREKRITELNEQGYGYTERHGK